MFERFKRIINPTTVETRSTNIGFISRARERFINGQDMDSSPGVMRLSSPYSQHVSIFRVINLIATSVSDVPFRINGDDVSTTKNKNFNILRSPNEVMNWNDLILTFVTDLLVGGNGIIIVESDGNNITRLLPMPACLMTPIINPNDEFDIIRWEKSNGPEKDPTIYSPEDVIHLPYAPSPINRVWGIGPMGPVKVVADADYAAMWNNFSLLNGGGLPVGILKFVGPGRLTEEMKEEVRDSWRRLFGSPRSSSRMAVVNQDWQWQPTGASKEELEFTANREWNVADICRAFNVPKLYLFEQERGAVGDSTIKIHQKMFYYNNAIPLARRIEDRLNQRLLPRIARGLMGTFDFEYVEALREDYGKKVETASTLVKMGFSPNSVNRTLGLNQEDMPWGEDSLAPVNMVPAQDIVDHAVILPKGQSGDKPQGVGSDAVDTTTEQSKEAASHTPTGLQEEWDNSYTLIDEIEERCSGQTRRALSLERTKIVSGQSTEIDGHAIANSMMKFLIRAYVSGYTSITIEENPSIYKNAAVYSNGRYDDILLLCDSFSELLRNKPIDDSDNRHERSTLNRIIRKINELCRPEIFRAFNTGRYVAMTDVGSSQCVWVASPETRCRDASNHGDKRTIGETFSTGHRYPGDSTLPATAGCDCIICPA